MELSRVAQFFLDAQELVVLGHAIGTAERASFDLTGISGHGYISDGGILCFSGTVGGNGGVACTMSHFDGIEGFRERANLIDLDEDGISASQFNAFF